MTEVAEMPVERTSLLRDLVALGKPGITAMCVLMTWGGLAIAPGSAPTSLVLWTLFGTTLSVAAANALNMYLEREGDKLMQRTRNRPLSSGRMPGWAAIVYGGVLGTASALVLAWKVNLLTAVLSVIALLLYVAVYTPAKRRTPLALELGAVPGAMPPLMGWTAARDAIEAPGVILFLILLLWQLPHFIAIALYRKHDYERAGIRVLPIVHGNDIAKRNAILYSALLVPVSLMLIPFGYAGYLYFVVASGLGAWFFILCAIGFEPKSGNRWARRFFLASLVYLPALTVALVVDGWVRTLG